MALIKCDGISIAYEGQTVVRDLSFWIEQGDYLCIVGENGSGKSTLVKSLLGLKPPFKGQILLGDGLKQDEIGYLPQQTVVQKDFPASVYEVVLSGRLNSRGWRPFYQLIEKSNKEAKIAVVMVSHDIESTIQYASHILHLQESALFYGTAQEYQNSAVGKRFLGGEGNA